MFSRKTRGQSRSSFCKKSPGRLLWAGRMVNYCLVLMGQTLHWVEKRVPWQQPSVFLCCRLYGPLLGQWDLDREDMHHRKVASLAFSFLSTLETGGLSLGAAPLMFVCFLLDANVSSRTAVCVFCFSLHSFSAFLTFKLLKIGWERKW